MNQETNPRGFSIEIKSKIHVRNISISNTSHNKVLFEGEIGKLIELSIIDDEVLVATGSNGTVRIDLKRDELFQLLTKVDASDLISTVEK